ncbi:MAG TPA: sec-independent translocase [Streptomyces sp.]|nr:sec-independent translocase [Streptomyces sp.]
MFFDIGPLELVALIILAVLVFGPDKLPKVIQDVSRFVRKIREFSDKARDDIREEMGPEFKDFEFEDLNPKNFARKHLLDNEELGLKEIRNGFDFRKDLAEVTDAVNGSERSAAAGAVGAAAGAAGAAGSSSRVDLTKDGGDSPSRPKDDPPPFDADAT